ncbi:L-lactate permease [Halodesulfovibrio spirochaetisodalis]|uniref:L-lactate permease n=1 Tax=Halodesulfovibrio spirochaetisodalis TaxID=1560234 RepID=A0A1B7X9D1_9BACT|nr:lactate permease LctP family transporter [Halodesulfovibrio spirochaetisodalis]OBQ45984.1 lactate permease [Halodesulfovibrio spirochaetisodalis]
MEYLSFLLALAPIAWLIFSLVVLKLPAHKTCTATLVATIAIAVFGEWHMPAFDAATAAAEGGALALWPIMIVIIAAVFTYNLSTKTGSMNVITKMLSGITTDRRLLVLIVAWGFGGFLEGVAGYGTAVAIPASILAAMGFAPMHAAVICLVANTVPTAFGAIGIPISTMASVTGIPVEVVSYLTAFQLTVFIVLITFLVVALVDGVKGLKGVIGACIVSGFSFALPQLYVAKFMGAELPCLVGSICSMAATIAYTRMAHRSTAAEAEDALTAKSKFLAWVPYILILTLIVLCSNLFPAIKDAAGSIKSVVTIYGDKPFTIKWIATPGVLIIIATYLGGMIQGVSVAEITKVLASTAKQLTKSAITVVAIVALAKVMSYSGMINTIALVIAELTGSFYPFISPMVGALGTFVTGSDTSSNVLFGQLQMQVAAKIGVDQAWLVSASAAGATAGKMISPQSIAIATAATGITGSEGRIMNKTIVVCCGYVLILGTLVYGLIPYLHVIY